MSIRHFRTLMYVGLCLLTMGLHVPGAAPPVANRNQHLVPVPPGVCFLPDVVYSKIGGSKLLLDLAYRTKGARLRPAVVVIPGWAGLNDRRRAPDYRRLMFRLAQEDYVTITLSYRSALSHPFPAQLDDVREAVHWLRTNAGKYRINKERIGVLGCCSGGHLACLLASTAEPASRVQAVVAYYAPTDLIQLHRSYQKRPLPQRLVGTVLLERWLGGPPEKVKERYRQASPTTHARKGWPPVLLIHGSADWIVPVDQSRLLDKKLCAAGVDVKLLELPNAGHGIGGGVGGKLGRKADDTALRFLARHLKAALAGR